MISRAQVCWLVGVQIDAGTSAPCRQAPGGAFGVVQADGQCSGCSVAPGFVPLVGVSRVAPSQQGSNTPGTTRASPWHRPCDIGEFWGWGRGSMGGAHVSSPPPNAVPSPVLPQNHWQMELVIGATQGSAPGLVVVWGLRRGLGCCWCAGSSPGLGSASPGVTSWHRGLALVALVHLSSAGGMNSARWARGASAAALLPAGVLCYPRGAGSPLCCLPWALHAHRRAWIEGFSSLGEGIGMEMGGEPHLCRVLERVLGARRAQRAPRGASRH